jgi:nucleotide-binding universal stress UspA family protein
MLRSVLVGVDGSEYSAAAVELGIQWAQHSGAVLVGLDVHFISSLPVKRLSACMAWGDTKPAQIVGAES